MDNKDIQCWMAMIKKLENGKCHLEEQQSNLEQRLLNLKKRISSTQNDICSCCSQCFEPTPTSNPPPVATPKVEKPYDLSAIPLNSMDMQYISTLYEIIDRETQLKEQVHKMKISEEALLDSLKPADQRCESRRTISHLKEENGRLSDELEDVKLQLRHCMEHYHGPMTRTLEQERRRSQQLVNDLYAITEEMSTKECCYREHVSCLKSQIEEVSQSLTEVAQQNKSLQRQLSSMGRKYKDLTRDLISQKLNEARTLERLNELLSEKERTVVRERRYKSQETQLDPQSFPQKEEKGKADEPTARIEHNLYAVARSLSKILLDINECDVCRESVPEDLKDVITGVKVISDIFDRNSTRNDATKSNDMKPADSGPGGEKRPLPPRLRDDSVSDMSAKADDDLYGGKSDGDGEDLTDATDLPVGDEVAVVQMKEGDIHVLTEVEASDDLRVLVDTLVEVGDDVANDIHVTTTVTSSGMLEVVTEGPAGIIETTMLRTPSGNLEVVTEIMEYPERLAIGESGDTSEDLESKMIEDVGAELERGENFVDSHYEPIANTAEEEELCSAHILDDSSDGEVADVTVESVLAPIMEVEGETPSHEIAKTVSSNFSEEVEEVMEIDKVPMNEIVSREPIRYVISDTTDPDRSKSGRKKHRQKFMSKIPVSASFPYKGPVCNCGKCGCVECFGRILAEPQGERGLDEKAESLASSKVCNLPDEVSLLTYTSVASARSTKPHPPDCDCVDCLCDPCASFPPDYATRIHPPDCDCIDCLCGEFPCDPRCTEPKPAATAKQIKVTVSERVESAPISETPTEPSEQSTVVEKVLPDERPIDEVSDQVDKAFVVGDGVNPEEVPVTANETTIEESVAVSVKEVAPEIAPDLIEERDPIERSAPAKILEPVSTVIENSSPVNQFQGEGEKLNHKAGCECDLCRCCKCGEVPPQLAAPQKCDRECDTAHRSNCSCIDCLLSCGIPNKPKEAPKAEGETNDFKISGGDVCDCVTCQNPCTSTTCAQAEEALPRQADLLCCVESQSGQNLLAMLRGIIENLQKKCTPENMANIVNELREKVNSLLFNQINFDHVHDACQHDIYSCACKEEKTDKRGAYLRNPCTCSPGVENIQNDSSSCCCFDQDEEESRLDESCSCISPQNRKGISPMSKISNVSLCSCTSYAEPQLICKQSSTSSLSHAMKITEVKKVSSEGLLVKWTPPTDQDVTGYEVLIDGKVKSKVRSAFRTSAIIYAVQTGSLNLKVYATTTQGRCEPPANAMYQF